MITLPVSLTSIRSAEAPAKPAGGAGETSFGEILERQVDAAPDAGQRGDRRPDDVLGTPPGQRLDRPPDAATDGASSPAVEHTHDRPAVAVDPGARTDDTDTDTNTDGDSDTDIDDGDQSAHGADIAAAGATVRQAPACQIAVPVDGAGQSLPAPSGQAPAEPALVAEVAAVSGTAVPAAGFVAAAVDPLTTAVAALPAQGAITRDVDAPTDATGTSVATGASGDGMPQVTGVTVATMPAHAAPTDATGPASTPAVPGGAAPTTFGASPVSRPVGTGPAASADPDAAPAAPTHPSIGDAGWVAAPPVTDDAAGTPPTLSTPAQPAAAPTGDPAVATTAVATTAVAATAATAAATSGADDGGTTTSRPHDQAPASVRAESPTGPVTGAGSAAATAPGASASTADAATADGLVSAPLRTSDIAAQAQRDAQIRRAEHLTRLGLDVTTDGLGAIHIEASNAGGGLQLNLGAERASTRHLLAEQVGVLRDELGAGVSVDIGGDAGRQPATHRGDERRLPGAPLAAATTASQPVDATLRRRPALSHLVDADRGLDLHL